VSQASGQSDVDRVREATDMVALVGEHVHLTRRGREHVGICPFHEDHSPSLCVVTHKGQAFYKCHACGAAGDVFGFVMEYHRKDFREALEFLAQRAGVALRPRSAAHEASPRDGLREINAFALAFFRRALRDPEAGAAARAALEERGIDASMVDRFQLGAAPPGYSGLSAALRDDAARREAARAAGLLKPRTDGSLYDAFRNRIIFPIFDEMGAPVAFGGRRLDPQDEPKYLNSSESPLFHKSQTLYGLHLARRAIIESRQAIVTEGYTDVIAAAQAGIENVVATLGTALTVEHARRLSRLCETVVLVFDGDEAGMKAAERALEVLFSQPVEVRICVLPGGQDPDDLLRTAGGPDRFRAAVAGATGALDFALERFAARLRAASSIAGRERLLQEFLGRLAEMGFNQVAGVRRRHVLASVAERLAVPVADLERALPRARPARADDATAAAPPASAPATGPARAVSYTRARVLAEHGLLAILVHDRTALNCPLPGGGTVADWFGEADFADADAAALYRSLLADAAGASVQSLLSRLESEAQRRLAAGLYFEGQRCCGDDGERTNDAMRHAAQVLRECVDKERYRQRMAAQTLSAAPQEQQVLLLEKLLDERRKHGDMTAAILPTSRR
jgi:DNA primase